MCVFVCFSWECYRYFILNSIWRWTFQSILITLIAISFDSDSFHNSVLFTRPGAILEEKETFVYFWEKKSIPSRYRVTNIKEVVYYLPSGFRRTRSQMSFLSTRLFPFLSYSLLNSGLLIFTEIRAVHSAELNPAMGIVIVGLSQFHGHTRICVRGRADALCLFVMTFTTDIF